MILVAIGTVATMAVSGMAVRGFLGGGGGANSPEAAVRQLVDAVNREDPIAAIDVLAPDEVRSLAKVLAIVQERVKHAGITTKRDDIYGGVDVTVADLEVSVEDLGPDTARVTARKGKVTVKTNVHEASEKAEELGLEDEEWTTDLAGPDADWVGGKGLYLMTVKRGGNWYVSVVYSIADWIVTDNEAAPGSFTDLGENLAEPAATPELALSEFVEAVGDLDVTTAASKLSQPEWSVLMAYRRAIQDSIDDARADGELEDWQVHLTTPSVEVTDLGHDRKKVVIKRLEASSEWTDEDGQHKTGTATYDGRCWTSTEDGEPAETECTSDSYIAHSLGLGDYFVVVTKERGGWALSPMSTLLQYGEEIAPRITDEMVYLAAFQPSLATPAGTLNPNGTQTVQLNAAGYATLTYTAAKDMTVAVGAGDGLDHVSLADEGGIFSWDGGSDIGPYTVVHLEAGTHTFMVSRDDYDGGRPGTVSMSTLEDQPLPAGALEDGRLSGSLSASQPVAVYSFHATDIETLDISAFEGDVEFGVLDEDGWDRCYDDTCELYGDGDYRLVVVAAHGEGGPFTLELTPQAETDYGTGDYSIDGGAYAEGSSVVPDVDTFRVVVGDGESVTIDIYPDDDDVDVRCIFDGKPYDDAGPGEDEEILLDGPIDADLVCAVTTEGSYSIDIYGE